MASRSAVRVVGPIVLLVGASLAIWSQQGSGPTNMRRDVDPVDRLDPGRPVDAQALWGLDILNGAPLGEQEVVDHLSGSFLEELPPPAFIASVEGFAAAPPFRFDGVLERRGPGMLVVRISDRAGETYAMVTVLSPDPTRVDGLQYTYYEPPQSTHDELQLLAALAVAATLVLAAFAPAPAGRVDPAWWCVASASLWLSQFAVASPSSLAFGAGLVLPWAVPGITASLLVLLPRTDVDLRLARWAPAAAGAATAVVGAGWLTRIETADIGLPANPIALSPDPGTAAELLDVRAVTSLLAVSALVALTVRARTRTGRRRAGAGDQPLVATLVAMAGVVAALAIVWLVDDHRASFIPPAWLSIGLAFGAAGIVAASLADRLRLGDMAQLVVDLGDDATGGSIETALRRALDDPGVQLLVWSPGSEQYLDAGGRSTVPDLTDRAATHLDADGRPLGLVLHDPSHRPEAIEAACSAVGLAIRNAQLQAELQVRLAEVEASRRRLLTATDDARRQLERDLHDGTQQRILSTVMDLQRARRRLAAEPGQASAALSDAVDHLRLTLDELRDLSRGLRPGALDRGLLPAVRELADRSPVPLTVHGDRLRTAPAVEHAAWFVISEAVTNAWKHAAAARISVTVAVADEELALEVSDDGSGGAAPTRDGGLEGLIDRVEALGGSVDLDSPRGRGTVLRAALPVRPGVDGDEVADEVDDEVAPCG